MRGCVRPSPTRVARRALVLSAVVCRSGIEANAGDPEAEAFRGRILPWLESAGAALEAEPDELMVLRTPLGSLSVRQIDSQPLLDVPAARWGECLSLARERQQAANWLGGQEALYSQVTCDT